MSIPSNARLVVPRCRYCGKAEDNCYCEPCPECGGMDEQECTCCEEVSIANGY